MKKGKPSADESASAILTLREVAQYLRVHESTVYRLVKQNKIPAFNVGSDWRFNMTEIQRWMVNQRRVKLT